jgi:glycosyltransferase involved in cell wall biosynthesis
MKLAICTPFFWPQYNGIGIGTTELSSRLSEIGYEVTVFAPREASQPDCDMLGRTKVIRCDCRGRGLIGSPYRGGIAEYRKMLRNCDADVYLFVCWENWMVDTAFPIFHELRGKKVLASHGASAGWRPPGLRGLVRRIAYLPHMLRYRHRISQFDFFTLLTEKSDKARFYDKYLLDERTQTNWTVIPNGAAAGNHVGCAGTFRGRYCLGNSIIILNVGNYHWAKNQKGLIRAFCRAQVKNSTLVLIGTKMNSYAHEMRLLCQKEGGQDARVLFLTGQSRQDIADAYRDSNLFASASITEVQPLCILDAMASSTPFVSLDVGCVAELPGGLAVKDEEELSRRIKFLSGDEEMRKHLGENGRRACLEVYNWEQTANAYDQVFQRMADDRSVNADDSMEHRTVTGGHCTLG